LRKTEMWLDHVKNDRGEQEKHRKPPSREAEIVR
jgi:hypothetical protein